MADGRVGVKLKPSEIPGFVDEYESPFPAAEMTAGVPGSSWTNIAEVTAPARAWRAANRISMLSIGRLATKHGVMKWQVPDVRRVGDLGQLALGTEFVDLAKKGAKLVGDLLDYSDALQTVASAVPVVGPYARIIVGFISFLKNAFSRGAAAKLDVRKTARDALGYNRQIDLDITNAAAEYLADDNWTRIFLPSWKPGDGFKLERTSFVGDGTPDGYSILPASGVQWEEGLGFCPGVAGRLVQWQYPLKVFNSNRPASPWESLISIADLEPSVTQLTVLAWQMVLKNSPSMFRINAYKIRERWESFFGELEDWSRWLRDKGDTQASQMAEAVSTWIGREYEPGGPYRVRNPWTKYGPKALEDTFVTPNAGKMVRFIMDRQYFPSLSPALATITCAYVGPGFAALGDDSNMLRDEWEGRRKQLLTHAARFDVELDMIPDADYRAAMRDATRKRPDNLPDVKKGMGGVPRFADPDKPPPSGETLEPTMPNSAGGGSGGGLQEGKGGDGDGGGGGGGGGAVVALAALGLGYVGWRKFGRRKVM